MKRSINYKGIGYDNDDIDVDDSNADGDDDDANCDNDDDGDDDAKGDDDGDNGDDDETSLARSDALGACTIWSLFLSAFSLPLSSLTWWTISQVPQPTCFMAVGEPD